MQDFLFDEFDFQASPATISRTLTRARWSRKAVKARAAERSRELRTLWIGRQADWSEDQLVFLDESACNERTGDRKFGWSPIGIECGVSRPAKKSQRWSILPAQSVNGYLSYLIYQGSITAETFELFVEQQVLSYCTPDFNPIEATFKDLKAWVKRNHRLAEEYESFEVFLHFVVSQSMGVNAGAHYREAGYIVN